MWDTIQSQWLSNLLANITYSANQRSLVSVDQFQRKLYSHSQSNLKEIDCAAHSDVPLLQSLGLYAMLDLGLHPRLKYCAALQLG